MPRGMLASVLLMRIGQSFASPHLAAPTTLPQHGCAASMPGGRSPITLASIRTSRRFHSRLIILDDRQHVVYGLVQRLRLFAAQVQFQHRPRAIVLTDRPPLMRPMLKVVRAFRHAAAQVRRQLHQRMAALAVPKSLQFARRGGDAIAPQPPRCTTRPKPMPSITTDADARSQLANCCACW